ncbi:uncharacterized protein LOC114247733 isoform X3 [Bombyx mandarina]|uniref:Uncharacterized protein LOC114247733 isoform X3 n=1 Tax=Bombyx mandarina TaxID=7092 RepID=A0A6J2K6H0_BOMMA|nr:uncharacterized protein LOC114247733 isoform X3 [Bombyx mandarina]
MCVFCFKELKRWCKSFTKPEICLSLLEAVFLIILVTSLTFLVQHFLACASRNVNEHVNTSTTFRHETTVPAIIPDQTKYYKQTTHKTFPPGIECTWKPSKKTRPTMRFFEYNQTESSFYELGIIQSGKLNISQAKSTPDTISDILGKDKKFDGEYAEDSFNNHVLALVKFKPPKDIIFGCILTIISEFWTITAASCIDAIEELDSLDSFVMLEDYGLEKKGQIHTLSDVQVHPFYQNGNKSYDLSVLKSEDSLTSGSRFPVELPNIIDYFLITVGESFTMLGFGPLRVDVDGQRCVQGSYGVEMHPATTVRGHRCCPNPCSLAS